MSKFCTACGSQMEDDARFCQSCGNEAMNTVESSMSTVQKTVPLGKSDDSTVTSSEVKSIKPTEYEFLLRCYWSGYPGDGRKVHLSVDNINIKIDIRRKVLFYTGKPNIRVIPIKEIRSVKYQKKISYFMLFLALAVSFIFLTGRLVHAAPLGLLFLVGLFNKNLDIYLNNGEVIELHKLNTTKFIQNLFDDLYKINPSILLSK